MSASGYCIAQSMDKNTPNAPKYLPSHIITPSELGSSTSTPILKPSTPDLGWTRVGYILERDHEVLTSIATPGLGLELLARGL